MYVTLEPCSHHGKTPPCTEAVIAAGAARLVAAMGDPFDQVDGQGFRSLRAAGVEVEVGLMAARAQRLVAPYSKLVSQGRPWLIAKWAMSRDGKLAAQLGDDRWISSPESRQIVHQIRGRVDAIIVGRRTAEVDDPLLTARPPGPRIATRIVLDSRASLPLSSQLVRTARDAPVLVAAGGLAAEESANGLQEAGVEVLRLDGLTYERRFEQLLDELGRRRMTNVLVEGGAGVLADLMRTQQVDEYHVFIAPRDISGQGPSLPFAGRGPEKIADELGLVNPEIREVGGDVYLRGRVERSLA